MTRRELQARYPNASDSFLRRNADAGDSEVRPAKPERAPRMPLVSAGKGKEKGSAGVVERVENTSPRRITYRVYSVRPLDWDNYRLKDLQDCLVEAGFLPDDNWRVLQGSVVSEKVHSKEEEKTVVEITPCH